MTNWPILVHWPVVVLLLLEEFETDGDPDCWNRVAYRTDNRTAAEESAVLRTADGIDCGGGGDRGEEGDGIHTAGAADTAVVDVFSRIRVATAFQSERLH